MDDVLIIFGFIGFLVFIVLTVINAVRKTGKWKRMLGLSAVCFILMIVGFSLVPVPETKNNTAQTEDKKANVEEKKETVKNDSTKEPEKKETTKKETEAKVTQETEEEKEAEPSVGSGAVAALQSNDFIRFTEEYKKLGKDKTPVWDNQLYGKKVTWTGTVVRAGSSQLFVYGPNDYNGETWDQLGDAKKLYLTFVAKYADPKQFEGLKPGDVVTVEGDLESRGDFDLDFNWKIYNAKLINKE